MSETTLPSSSREMRNRAEKQRRDKLNSYIQELYSLVPSAASAPRKLDKTSTLRLSANFLRIHQNADLRAKPYSRWNVEAGHLILEKLDSFLLVVSCCSGKIIYVSDRVEKLLGHAQVDMMGYQLSSFVHQADQEAIDKRLSAFAAQATMNPDAANSSSGQVYSFECRLAGRQLSRGEPTVYESVAISGTFRGPRRRSDWFEKTMKGSDRSGTLAQQQLQLQLQQSNGYSEPLFIGVVRLLQTPNTLPPLTLMQATQDEYFTQHTPTGIIIQTDHRIALVAGYLSGEVTGMSAYNFIWSEDMEYSLKAQSLMLSQNQGLVTYRLKTSTGRLIYLRSRGFIQYDDATKEITGFFCINSEIDEEQGKKEINALRKSLEDLSISPIISPTLAHPSNSARSIRALDPPPPPLARVPNGALSKEAKPPVNVNGYAQQQYPTQMNGVQRTPVASSNYAPPPMTAVVTGTPGPSGVRLTAPAISCSSPGSEQIYSPSDSSSSFGTEDRSISTTPQSNISSPIEIAGGQLLTLSYIPVPFAWQPSHELSTLVTSGAVTDLNSSQANGNETTRNGMSGMEGDKTGTSLGASSVATRIPFLTSDQWDSSNSQGIVIRPAVGLLSNQHPLVVITHQQPPSCSTGDSFISVPQQHQSFHVPFQVPDPINPQPVPQQQMLHREETLQMSSSNEFNRNQRNACTNWSTEMVSPAIQGNMKKEKLIKSSEGDGICGFKETETVEQHY